MKIKLTKHDEPEVYVSGGRVELTGTLDELVFQLGLALYAIKKESGWSTEKCMCRLITAFGAIVAVEEEE